MKKTPTQKAPSEHTEEKIQPPETENLKNPVPETTENAVVEDTPMAEEPILPP